MRTDLPYDAGCDRQGIGRRECLPYGMVTPPLADVLQALVCMHLIIMLLNMKQLRMDQTPPPSDLSELLQASTKVLSYSHTVDARSQAPENVNSILHSSINNGQHQPCGGGPAFGGFQGFPALGGTNPRRKRSGANPSINASMTWLPFHNLCGGGGIRTPGPGLPINGFQDRRFRPLSHSSTLPGSAGY